MKQLNNTNSKRKIYFIICIILILIIALSGLLVTVKKQKEKENTLRKVQIYTDPNDFKTIKEVSTYLDCEYVKQENSKINEYTYDIYINIKYEPYTNNESNELFYDRLISYCAKVLEYKSFRIIDKKNNITIEVICNMEYKKIKKKIINGQDNYFSKHDSLLELNSFNKIEEKNIEVQSNIIQNLITNNWNIPIDGFGKKESTFNKYDIYFNEGIQVRKVNNKIFNIIFTKNYKENIANGIKTSSTKEEIIKKLGQPSFENEQYGIFGYKGTEIYLFFNNMQEISIYRVEKNYNSTDFASYIDKYLEEKDENLLINNVKNKYQDFDKYQNNSDGIILTYSLRGVEIKFEKNTGRGVQIYKNYSGIIYKDINLDNLVERKDIPDNIFINNEDLVFKNEVNREIELFNLEETARMKDAGNSDEIKSKKFYTVEIKTETNSSQIIFISSDKANPNYELKENADYFLWLDDYNFVYSKKNNGIYVFNLKQGKYGTLIKGNEEFKLIEYKNNILKYDEKKIEIKNNYTVFS